MYSVGTVFGVSFHPNCIMRTSAILLTFLLDFARCLQEDVCIIIQCSESVVRYLYNPEEAQCLTSSSKLCCLLEPPDGISVAQARAHGYPNKYGEVPAKNKR
jgi:hypothetical protein